MSGLGRLNDPEVRAALERTYGPPLTDEQKAQRDADRKAARAKREASS